MKILTVVYSLEKGGTQRAAQNFAEAYFLNGHDSKLLVTTFDGLRRHELTASGVHVWVNVSKPVLSEISNWGPDIVHLHSHELRLEEVNIILECAKYATVIETNVFSEPSAWVSKVHNSYQLSEWCQWLYKKRSEHIYPSNIVPYPVRTETFSRASDDLIAEFRKKYHISESDVLIGRIGQAYEAKWSTLIIKVFNKLKNNCTKVKDFKLLLVNPPDSIREMASNSKFKDSIIIIDSILGDENLSIAYSAIDIFVLISAIGESFGMVLAEAMLCETPIVAFSTPWADNSQCEVVGNMEGGLVATTSAGLHDAIMKLSNNPELRKVIGRRARKRVVENYEYRKVARLALEKVNLLNIDKPQKNVPHVYYNSFDKPHFVSKLLLSSGWRLDLMRYISGYFSLNVFFKRLILKLIKPIHYFIHRSN